MDIDFILLLLNLPRACRRNGSNPLTDVILIMLEECRGTLDVIEQYWGEIGDCVLYMPNQMARTCSHQSLSNFQNNIHQRIQIKFDIIFSLYSLILCILQNWARQNSIVLEKRSNYLDQLSNFQFSQYRREAGKVFKFQKLKKENNLLSPSLYPLPFKYLQKIFRTTFLFHPLRSLPSQRKKRLAKCQKFRHQTL